MKVVDRADQPADIKRANEAPIKVIFLPKCSEYQIDNIDPIIHPRTTFDTAQPVSSEFSWKYFWIEEIAPEITEVSYPNRNPPIEEIRASLNR